MRYQGLSILKDAQIQISKGQPLQRLWHSCFAFGIDAHYPGFTDGIGFLLLLPPVRSRLDFVVGT